MTLGYWREMKDRRAFAKAHDIELQPRGLKGILTELGLFLSVILLSVGAMSNVFMAFPELARLPFVLCKGYMPEARPSFLTGLLVSTP